MKEKTEHWSKIEALLGELIEESKGNLLRLGRKIIPSLTPEDILQPNDYPELENYPEFRYEEGIVAGLQTAETALKALRNDLIGKAEGRGQKAD